MEINLDMKRVAERSTTTMSSLVGQLSIELAAAGDQIDQLQQAVEKLQAEKRDLVAELEARTADLEAARAENVDSPMDDAPMDDAPKTLKKKGN